MKIELDPKSPVPPYEQICAAVVAAIGAGELPVGSQLPTVRALADNLGVAINTVAKAYKRLEGEGHVATNGRNGTRVLTPRGAQLDEVTLAARTFAALAQGRGLDLRGAIGVLRQAW